MIPYGRQQISPEDIDAVVDVLSSDFLTQGPMVPRFEQALADYIGVKFAVAVNSATSALHIACLALDLAPGDLLWTTPNTFVASANCARYCGADVDFVDIDSRTFNLCTKKLEAKLIEAEQAGRLPKILVPVHLCGQSCDMEAIASLAKRYGFRIVEDASHAIGAKYKDQYVGGGHHSDVTIFSFHPVKIITTGEGGVATTKCPHLARRMASLRSHGITRDANYMLPPTSIQDHGPWYYQQIELGFNYRMTEMQAALGYSQLDRLDDFVEKRRTLAKRYDQLLAHLPIRLPYQLPDTASSWHLYVIQTQSVEHHRALFEALRACNIGVNLHYIPVHTQPYYQNLGFERGDFPASEDYYARSISIPVFAGMTISQQDEVCKALEKCVKAVESK